MGAAQSVAKDNGNLSTKDNERAQLTETLAQILNSFDFDHYTRFPSELISETVEYVMIEFIPLDTGHSLHIYNNFAMRTRQHLSNGIYSLAFLPTQFDERHVSRFNFFIVRQELNVVIGCMLIYKTNNETNKPLSASMIKKLLSKHNNHSLQSNYIGSGSNGYSYDSSGLLLHNNQLNDKFNEKLKSGTLFTMQYDPVRCTIDFFIDGVQQHDNFSNVKLKKCQKLVPIIALSTKNECVNFLSFDIL